RYVTNGDEAAFELLVWRHGGLVFGVCRRVLGDSHAAEDAFQATFLALARKARAVRRGEALAGWLHRVARRVASRARAAAAVRAGLAYATGAAAGVAPQAIDWADGVIRAMMLSKLKVAAGVALAAGMLGFGGAWVVVPGGGPAMALAEGPQDATKRADQAE